MAHPALDFFCEPPHIPNVARRLKRITTVQAYRGLAALIVILQHESKWIFGSRKYFPDSWLSNSVNFGELCVDFFFVLSGFIIFAVHRRDIGREHAAGSYLRKRLLRVYPTYWAVMIPLIALYLLLPSFGHGFERDPAVILSSLTLVGGWLFSPQQTPMTILPAAWTMYYEILFYAVFLALVAHRRLGTILLGCWMTGCMLNLLFGPFALPAPYFIAPRSLLFGMGMAASWLFGYGKLRHPTAMVSLAAGLILAAGLGECWPRLIPPIDLRMLGGLGSACMILGLAELEQAGRIRAPIALALLGEAAYSIYLLHGPVLILTAKLGQHLPPMPVTLSFLLYFLIAAGAGILLHLHVERPLLARGRAWADRIERRPTSIRLASMHLMPMHLMQTQRSRPPPHDAPNHRAGR